MAKHSIQTIGDDRQNLDFHGRFHPQPMATGPPLPAGNHSDFSVTHFDWLGSLICFLFDFDMAGCQTLIRGRTKRPMVAQTAAVFDTYRHIFPTDRFSSIPPFAIIGAPPPGGHLAGRQITKSHSMQGLCFESVGVVGIRNLPDPKIESAQDAIVQVQMAGLCGSDLHPFWGRESGMDPGTVMGHEFVGNVVEVGNEVRNFRVGDTVFAPFSTNCGQCDFCRQGLPSRCPDGRLFGWRSQQQGLHGGQAQYIRVPLADGTLLTVPPGVSHELALLLGDNLSTGFYCCDLADLHPDGTYVVIGCGNVGLMALVAAQLKGCSRIIAVDPVPQRRQLAERLGALAVGPEVAAECVKQRSGGLGATAVMELVGMPVAQRLAYELLRPGGTIATVGCHCDPAFAFSPVEAYDKNLTYRTGRCPARYYMDQLPQRAEIQSLDWSPFITHRFSLAEGPRAYQLFSERQDGIVKGVFEVDG